MTGLKIDSQILFYRIPLLVFLETPNIGKTFRLNGKSTLKYLSSICVIDFDTI